MTPPILARVAQLHGSSDEADCNTITTTTSWEYVSKSSSLSDLTRFGAGFFSSSSSSNNHTKQELGSSSSTTSCQNPIGRSLLPLGIVPLPSTHRHGHHNNGFHHLPHHGYRLTQQDLLQPIPDRKHESSLTNDSNPVMRSTSFNLDYNAAKRHTFKYRQPSIDSNGSTANTKCNQLNVNQNSQVQPKLLGKGANNRPRQQAIVLVAENPESGASDVYNVPFQSDIYSLPVDTVFTGNEDNSKRKGFSSKRNSTNSITNTTQSSSSANLSQINLNQRLSKPEIGSTSKNAVTVTTAISQKTNLTRKTSCGSDSSSANECGTKRIVSNSNNSSSHTRDLNSSSHQQERRSSQSRPPLDDDLEPCKPPQRTTSLSTQQSQPQSLINDIPLPAPPVLSKPKPPINSYQEALTEFKPIPPVRTTTAMNNTSARLSIEKSGDVARNRNESSRHSHEVTSFNLSVKKPRSRSVDPGNELERGCPARTSIKRNVDAAYTQSSSNSQILCEDAPSVMTGHNCATESDHNLLLGNSSKDHTNTDRKNPLGMSLLNLFRRNKSSSTSNEGAVAISSKHPNQTLLKLESDTHEDDETEGTEMTSSNSNSEAINTTSINSHNGNSNVGSVNNNNNKDDATCYYFRDLPPPPPGHHSDSSSDEQGFSPVTSPLECKDFAASIERVKDCGWYWGPLSSEAAEDLLKNEPDGSFIVRDSSDVRYIFSLTFKLNGLVRHVRIEHDQGNFSFGPLTRFKAATIVDFVEKAVAHSRSGRYLFFLHRRPVLGPMQVQLLHPYSRFMHARSLKHMCRFVILKYVRRDLIHTLPLPKPMQDYLNTPHYYFEERNGCSGGGEMSDGVIPRKGTRHHSNNVGI